jgi:hypothetical protein
MTGWAEEWTSALNQQAKSDVDEHQTHVGIAATHTPHPALASSRETSEWEAVLSATEAAAVPPAAAAAAVTKDAAGSTGNGVFAVIELGSHSTRLLLSDAVSGMDVVSTPRTPHFLRHAARSAARYWHNVQKMLHFAG